jgi:hypothetical protein
VLCIFSRGARQRKEFGEHPVCIRAVSYVPRSSFSHHRTAPCDLDDDALYSLYYQQITDLSSKTFEVTQLSLVLLLFTKFTPDVIKAIPPTPATYRELCFGSGHNRQLYSTSLLIFIVDSCVGAGRAAVLITHKS